MRYENCTHRRQARPKWNRFVTRYRVLLDHVWTIPRYIYWTRIGTTENMVPFDKMSNVDLSICLVKKVESFQPSRSTDEMSSVQNLACQFFFFSNCCTWSIKIFEGTGRTWACNLLNTKLRASMIKYFMFAKSDNYRRCNKIKHYRSQNIIIRLSSKLFLNYRHYNAYR